MVKFHYLLCYDVPIEEVSSCETYFVLDCKICSHLYQCSYLLNYFNLNDVNKFKAIQINVKFGNFHTKICPEDALLQFMF